MVLFSWGTGEGQDDGIDDGGAPASWRNIKRKQCALLPGSAVLVVVAAGGQT